MHLPTPLSTLTTPLYLLTQRPHRQMRLQQPQMQEPVKLHLFACGHRFGHDALHHHCHRTIQKVQRLFRRRERGSHLFALLAISKPNDTHASLDQRCIGAGVLTNHAQMAATFLIARPVVSRRHPDVKRKGSSLVTADASAAVHEVVMPRSRVDSRHH